MPTPELCRRQDCALLFGEIGDAATFFLNGRALGDGDAYPKVVTHGKRTPVMALIDRSLWRMDAEQNRLEMHVYSFKFNQTGPRRLPAGIVTEQDAGRYLETYRLRSIMLPLGGALCLLLVVALMICCPLGSLKRSRSFAIFLLYCLSGSLFLLSFAEVLRGHVPTNAAVPLHVTLRYLSDWAFFQLVVLLLGIQQRWTGLVDVAFMCTLTLLAVCVGVGMLPPPRVSELGVAAKVYAALPFSTALNFAGTMAGLVGFRHLSDRRMRCVVLLAFAVLLSLQLRDAAIFLGMAQGNYASRFYPLVIGIVLAGALLRKSAMAHTEKLFEAKNEASLGRLASQVAHDIRSPLAALNVALQAMGNLPEEQRVLVRSAVSRINDIANVLLINAQKQLAGSERRVAPQRSPQPVFQLVDSVLAEARMKCRSRADLGVESDLGETDYDLFVDVDPSEMKRVLANLVNNAMEAIERKGRVSVRAEARDATVTLHVSDNGKGIEPEVLKQLGKRGATFGKTGGSGLGLAHAKEYLGLIGGDLSIDSVLGKGTTVRVTVPRVQAPSWFVPALEFDTDSHVHVLDDDESIHHIWRQRFAKWAKTSKLAVSYHRSPDDMLAEVAHCSSAVRSPNWYLLDHELIGSSLTGLDVAGRLGAGRRCILVTSRGDESTVQSACQRLGIGLIMKGMAPYVPIRLIQGTERIDAVLVDDDPLVHQTWELQAHALQKRVLSIHDPSALFTSLATVDVETAIYVDFNLGDAWQAEELCQRLCDLGFNNIYVCTGADASALPHLPYVKGIVGKSPPASWARSS